MVWGYRYREWIKNYVDKDVFYDPIFDRLANVQPPNRAFEYLTADDIYKLRCSFLHSGNDDIESSRIDEFELIKPGGLGSDIKGRDYGYKYAKREDEQGNEIHIANLNIKYICEMLCMFAEKYYQTKQPEDFEEHTWKLG